MTCKYWGNPEFMKFIRHRKIGDFELYIYKDHMSGR